MNAKSHDVWILVHPRKEAVDEVTFGLVSEARRIFSVSGEQPTVTAIIVGDGLGDQLERMAERGIDRVRSLEAKELGHYQGDLFSKLLSPLVLQHKPSCIFAVQGPEMADLCARMAAILDTGLVTRAVDLNLDENDRLVATRPISNGYLFEKVGFDHPDPPFVCFLPSVLSIPEHRIRMKMEVINEPVGNLHLLSEIRVTEIIQAAPEDLNLEEADVIVAAGRGVGREQAFDIVHEFAESIGGSVGGTRPVIDCQALPFQRQIGQTGKTVAPRLLIACGISGANEFTAGMEKSQRVIAINKDSRARIFRFSDLGVEGDVHEILTLLVRRIKEMENQ
jgi:electron transfer flavoprotein alpha subunit